MTLKNLVPPLELCKRISDGAFSDSALVWVCGHTSDSAFIVEPTVVERNSTDALCDKMVEYYKCEVFEYPAPTLAEIMTVLPDGVQLRMRTTGNRSRAFQIYHYSLGDWTTNPASGALRLWLKLKGI